MFRFALGSKVPLLLVGIFLLTLNVVGLSLDKRSSKSERKVPPPGAVVVKPHGATTATREFTSIRAAVQSLPLDGSAQVIFIYPGTYAEQINITRFGSLTIYGYTTDTTYYTRNTVTITHSASLGSAGKDADSGTLMVHTADFKLYNVNIINAFGKSSTNGQAIAIAAFETRQGYYGVKFYSHQDTVYANTGVQFYGRCYIQGDVDFIFGRFANAYFQKNTIASSGPGAIVASGPYNSTTGIFVINDSQIILTPKAVPKTHGKVYLARPWSEFARVVFSNSNLGSHINEAGWSAWSNAVPNTDHVLFGEFANTGPGAATGKRASFATKLTSNNGYTMADILGTDYSTWVDTHYI